MGTTVDSRLDGGFIRPLRPSCLLRPVPIRIPLSRLSGGRATGRAHNEIGANGDLLITIVFRMFDPV